MMSAIRVNWDLTRFVDRPIGLGLMVATIAVVVVGIVLQRRQSL